MAVQRFSFLSKNLAMSNNAYDISSGSNTSANLFDFNPQTKWKSVGELTGGLTSTIFFSIASETYISRLAIINHNFKDFRAGWAFVDTPNATITIGYFDTVSNNANSNTYYSFPTQLANVIGIACWNTFLTNTEKFCGEIIAAKHNFTLEHNPEYTEYQPTFYKKGFEFEKYGGGIESVFFGTKFRANINLNYINTATYNSMKDLYNDHDDFIFVPYGQDTTTSNWNGEIYPVNWVGDLQIDNLINNNLSNGFTGNINLMQI